MRKFFSNEERLMLVAPCGHTQVAKWTQYRDGKPFQEMEVTEDQFRREHVDNCRVCRILTGKSKVTVLPQDALGNIFAHGAEKGHTSRHSVSIQGPRFYHYSVVAAVRTNQGEIIVNTQDWALGFAKVPHVPDDLVSAHLPLTSIDDDVRADLETIELLDKDEQGNILFTVSSSIRRWTSDGVRYDVVKKWIMFGHDEGPFLVQVPDEPETIKEAFDALRPDGVPDDALRQGDLFFVPYDGPMDGLMQKAHFELVCETSDRTHLVRPEILDTRHTADRLMEIDGNVVVSGKIRHPEHRTITLTKPHVVVKNRALGSWNARRRGGGMD